MNEQKKQQLQQSLTPAASLSPDLLTLLNLRIGTATQLPPTEFLLRLFGTPCFPRGELVGVAGKAKSGKTLFISMLMAAACGEGAVMDIRRGREEPLRVMWYDTEQSSQSTQEILRDRIAPLTGGRQEEGLCAFNVRTLHWDRRMALLEQGIAYSQPDLVVIDGVRDLVSDINDGIRAQETIERLMRTAEAHRCCIVTVLHQNKGDDRSLRGWIGTELLNKAYEVYVCEKLMPSRTFSVEQTHTRRHDLDRLMYFGVDERGLPCRSDAPEETMQRSAGGLNRAYVLSRPDGSWDIDLRRLFSDTFRGEPLIYTTLQTRSMELLNCREISFWLRQYNKAREAGIITQTLTPEGAVLWSLGR